MKTYLNSLENIDLEYELLDLEFLFIQSSYGRTIY